MMLLQVMTMLMRIMVFHWNIVWWQCWFLLRILVLYIWIWYDDNANVNIGFSFRYHMMTILIAAENIYIIHLNMIWWQWILVLYQQQQQGESGNCSPSGNLMFTNSLPHVLNIVMMIVMMNIQRIYVVEIFSRSNKMLKLPPKKDFCLLPNKSGKWAFFYSIPFVVWSNLQDVA